MSAGESSNLQYVAENYLSTLIGDGAEAFLSLVGDNAVIADPQCGRHEQARSALGLHAGFNEWLKGRELSAQHLRTTASPERVCSEDILHVRGGDETLELPVATVVSSLNDGLRIHVYYTRWPFNKRHSVFPALFPQPETDAHHSGVILKYFECLNSGNLDRLVTCFEADVYFREASGPPYVHWGTEAVRSYFMGLFRKGAPMLRDDTITDDGRCAVMEFTVVGWNGEPRDPSDWEAGLACYERSRDGLMSGIRIYDDVDF